VISSSVKSSLEEENFPVAPEDKLNPLPDPLDSSKN
jgi:hypothetical protein